MTQMGSGDIEISRWFLVLGMVSGSTRKFGACQSPPASQSGLVRAPRVEGRERGARAIYVCSERHLETCPTFTAINSLSLVLVGKAESASAWRPTNSLTPCPTSLCQSIIDKLVLAQSPFSRRFSDSDSFMVRATGSTGATRLAFRAVSQFTYSSNSDRTSLPVSRRYSAFQGPRLIVLNCNSVPT